jgi:GNAT superfamily N-acetyltransferase
MGSRKTAGGSLRFRPLTPKTWPDFVALFGKSGACGGCWCMWWRQTRREFDERHGEKNKRAMKRLVDSGEVPGILAYEAREPVGWCSVAPRDSFESLNRSRVLKRLDDQPVWSIVCLFLARSHRNRGLTTALIEGAVEHVRASGGRIVEAYPTRPRGKKLDPVSSFMGVPASFERAGFVECARPSEAKVVMRRRIGGKAR